MKKLIGLLLLASSSIAMAANVPTPMTTGKLPAACAKKRGHIPPPCLVPPAPKK